MGLLHAVLDVKRTTQTMAIFDVPPDVTYNEMQALAKRYTKEIHPFKSLYAKCSSRVRDYDDTSSEFTTISGVRSSPPFSAMRFNFAIKLTMEIEIH